ncbi:MAG: PKD domain-containing protein, partial [Bifidobacteriaceae bacterium]|nr:PKD domain-containing protein [Bifidobacteriaceae bacterium]
MVLSSFSRTNYSPAHRSPRPKSPLAILAATRRPRHKGRSGPLASLGSSSASTASPGSSRRRTRLDRPTGAARRTRRIVAIVTALALTGGVAAPSLADYPSTWAEAQFWLTQNGYGPNQAVTIQVGSLSPGCDPFSGIVRISDVYVVRAGSVSAGGTLSDVSGQPNTFSSVLSGGAIMDEIIGITKPSGSMGSGDYDIVEDVCQNGRFDPDMDAILPNAFTVTIPSDIPNLPDPALQAIKTNAQQEWELWRTASPYLHLLGAAIIIGTLPEDGLDLAQEIIISGITWIMSCASVGDCQMNIGALELWNVFMQMAMISAAQASHYKGLAADPPSPDFAEPVTLGQPTSYQATPEDPLERAALDYMRALDESTRLTQGLLDAMERYQGAQLADDAPAALMQAQAGSALSNQLKAALTRENTAADALVAALNATGYNQATTISQIRTWQQRVAANGLSAADRAGLANLGFTAPGDEARFRQFVLDLPTDPQFANLAAMVSQEKTRNNAMNTALTTFGTAWDGLAATITDLVDDAAQTAYPTVTATVPASSVVGLAVSLAATATGDGAIDLTWDFDGDGHFDDATGMSVSFTPVRPGPQRVGVQACDGDGRCAITYTALDPRVVGGPPTVTATPANNTIQAVYVGDSLDLTAQFADTDGDTLNVAWLDGETAPVAPGTPPAVSEGGTLTVQGDASRRTRGVSAQATDPAGNMATARWTVLSFDPDDDGDGWTNPVDCVPDNPNINPGKAEVPGNGLDDDCDPSTPDAGPPVASFVTTPAIGIVGEPVTFTSTSTSPSGIRQYWWDLDGNGAWDTTSVSPSRTYTAPGLVPVNLTVRDNQGQGADATRNVRVTDRPVAAISASPGVAVPAGDTITLSSLSTDQDGGVASVEWDLDYNGASFFTETTTDNPQVVVNGPVTVALRVTDIYGAVSEIATVRLLTEGAPTAAFTSTPNGGQANLALPSSDASVVDYSSRYDSSRGPEQAIAYKADSNNGVYWRSAMGHTSGEWMIVDLGQEYELSAIALRTAYGNTGRIKDIRLSIGSDPDDPASFRPWVVDEFPNISQKVTWQAIDCGPVGRYVRLDVDSIWSGTDFYLAAFEVYSGQVGLADVQFTDHSVDPDAGGSIDAWYWSFGDGATSAEHNPHHVYPGPGIYTVTLTVQDAAGDQDTISGTYEVRVPLAASFTMVPAVAALGQEVVVTDTTLAPAGSSLASRSWDLDGNGTADSTANPARRSYAEPGLYSVTLTDITNTGQIGFASRDLRVTDRPVAEFTASAWEVAADKAVTLTDTSTDADGGVAAWEWDFDYDGVDFTTNSILQHPTYVPGHPVTVALRVTDVYGLVSEIVTHQIAVPGPPVPAFRSEATTGLVNVALDVHGASLVASSSQYSSSYAADIPIWWRGANPTGSWCTLTGSTGGWVVYDLGATYPLTAVALRGYSGTYGPKNVRVSLGTDPDDPDTFTPLVVGQLPQSAARAEWAALGAPAVGRYLRVDLEDNWGGPYTCLTSLEAMSGALGGPTVQLTDLSRDPDLGGAITAWAWDFGDGDTSAEQNPEHTYTEPGVYAVTLAATDSEGLTRTTTQRYEVKAPLAVPAFSVDVSTTSEGDRRRHTDNTVPTDRGVVTRTWVWGDGSANTVATANFVDHIWLDSGLLGVTLTVVDTYGLSASLIQTVSVANVAPVVSIRGQAWEVGFGRGETRVFAGISGQVMRNMVLAVTDAGSGDAATMLCTVDWGDGSPQHEAQPCYGQSLLQAVYHTYEQVGRYTVTITAVDKDGGTGRASTGLVVQPTSYLLVYPVTGTDFDGEVTVRVKLWDVQADSSSAPPWSQWFVVEGALVDVAVGDETWTVTTDANGEAEVRVSYALGDTVTAVFAGRPGVPAARDVNDLAQIGKPAVDIMILVDEGWWVADAQSALRNALPFLESQFGDSGVDYHIGLAGMASGYVPSPTVLEMPATTHLEDFALTTNLLDEAHGAALAVDSTVESFGPRFGFRPEAKQCVVPIFDEVTGHPQNDGAQAAALLAEHEATIFPIMTLTDKHVDTVNADAARAVLTELARDSGGQVFDLPDFVDDPEAVLGTVLAGCVSLRMQRADLAVTVTDDSDTTWAGASRTYSVTVRNDGEQDATGVRVELTLTGPQTVGAISHDGASVPGQDVGETVVTWSDLDILAGDQVVLTVERTVDSDAAVDSELGAAVTAQDDGTHGTDLTPANNQAADSTLVALATVIDLAVADDSKVYGEADPGFALTGLPAGWVEGTDYIVAFDREAGEDVGGYEITADVVILRAGHSLGTVDPGTLTITQRSLTATVGSADRVQTGLPVSAFLPVTFTGLRAGDTGSPNGTMVSGVLVGDYPSTLAASAVSVTRGGSPVTG